MSTNIRAIKKIGEMGESKKRQNRYSVSRPSIVIESDPTEKEHFDCNGKNVPLAQYSFNYIKVHREH